MRKHDVDRVVIGTGTGLDVASWVVSHGWRVAVADKGPAGGACLNRGCIPSKMLIHVADVARATEAASKLGICSGPPEIRFDEIMRRVRRHVDGESARIDEALRRSSNPLYLRGEAHFVGRRTVRVGEDEVVARRIVLATGARPRIPTIPGLQETRYITSTEARPRPPAREHDHARRRLHRCRPWPLLRCTGHARHHHPPTRLDAPPG